MTYALTACFLLHPEGTFRFGAHADDLGEVHPFPGSDSLFGALAWAQSLDRGEDQASEWVQRFVDGRPPFLISSALPFDEETGTALVPRPLRRRSGSIGDEVNRKLLKRALYVDLDVLRWFDGDVSVEPRAVGPILAAGTGRIAREGWRTVAVPGVAVDRLTSASQVYSVALTHYRWSLALYAAADDEHDLAHLERLLTILSVTGIGGRKSRGSGKFTWRRIESPLALSEGPTGASLSLIWPRREELEAGALSPPQGFGYRLVERHGWISAPSWVSERSRTVTMIAEGSFLKQTVSTPIGGMADVTPDERRGRHRVYRYGYGLFLDGNGAKS